MTTAQGAAAVSHPIARYIAPGSAPAPSKGTPSTQRRRGIAASVVRITNFEYHLPKASSRPCISGRCACAMQEQMTFQGRAILWSYSNWGYVNWAV